MIDILPTFTLKAATTLKKSDFHGLQIVIQVLGNSICFLRKRKQTTATKKSRRTNTLFFGNPPLSCVKMSFLWCLQLRSATRAVWKPKLLLSLSAQQPCSLGPLPLIRVFRRLTTSKSTNVDFFLFVHVGCSWRCLELFGGENTEGHLFMLVS